VLAVISGVVVYAVGMVGRVEENLRPEEDAPSITEEIQTLEEYKGDVVNILVCGIDYEEGRNYSNDPTSNDGMTDMILYCQFDIKGGALRMLQIPRNSLVTTKSRKVTLSNGKTYAATNYQINSVALSNGGSIAALAEVIYDQYKLPVDYYVTVDMQALVEMVDNFGGIEVYIPHDMSFAGSALKQGYRNLDGTSAEFFVRCRHGQGYSNSDIDRLNMQRYFYAGLFKRVRSMGITDVLNQLPLVFNNYIHTDMDLTTIAKMLVSFTRIDSANIMLAQTPVFMGVPNVGVTDTSDGYSCVVPDAGSIAELLNTYFRSYTGPVSASELNLVTNDWPHGTASTSANVQFVGQLDKQSDDAILSGNTDVAGATPPAMTGGYGSSYGTQAGQNAYASTMNSLDNVLDSLYSQSKAQYNTEKSGLQQQLSGLQSAEKQDYSQYQNDLANWTEGLQYKKNEYDNAYSAKQNGWQNFMNGALQVAGIAAKILPLFFI